DFGLIPGIENRDCLTDRPRRSLGFAHVGDGRGEIWVQQHPDSGGRRNNIEQQPQALLGKLGAEDVDPGRIAAGPGKAGYEPEPDRIGAGVEYDWDSCGRLLSRRSGCFAADRDDNGDPAGYEVGRQGWHPVVAPLCPAILDDDVAPHLEPHLLQTATEAFVEV